MIVHLLALSDIQWTPLIRILQARGVVRDFSLAVEPPNSYSTRGSSRPHILPATQVDLLLGR